MTEEKIKTVRCWCSVCGREQNHAQLFSHVETERVDVSKGEYPNSEQAEVLKCLGCDALNTRHTYAWDAIAEIIDDVH